MDFFNLKVYLLSPRMNFTANATQAISASFDPESPLMGFVYFIGAFAILASCAGIYDAAMRSSPKPVDSPV